MKNNFGFNTVSIPAAANNEPEYEKRVN